LWRELNRPKTFRVVPLISGTPTETRSSVTLTDQRRDDGGAVATPRGLFNLSAGAQSDHRLDENVADPDFYAAVAASGQVHVPGVRRFVQRPDDAEMRRRLGHVLRRVVVLARVHETVHGADQVGVRIEPQRPGRAAHGRRTVFRTFRLAAATTVAAAVSPAPFAVVVDRGQSHDGFSGQRPAHVPVPGNPAAETTRHLERAPVSGIFVFFYDGFHCRSDPKSAHLPNSSSGHKPTADFTRFLSS